MAKLNPLVSIVVPTYNHRLFIHYAIQSINIQTYRNIELIIINDGSTDGTSEYLNGLDLNDEFSLKIIHQDNQGQAASLNKGWSLSSGAYLAYLSSDDVLYPHAIETMVKHLQDNPKTVCAYPDSNLIDRDGFLVKRKICKNFNIKNCIVNQTCNIGPGAVFRRTAFELVGGWRHDLRLGPDRYFWIKAAEIGRIDFIDEVHAGYRFHEDAISYKEQSEFVSREYLRLTKQIFEEISYENLGLTSENRNQAIAQSYLIVARNRLRSASLRRALLYYKIACKYDKSLNKANTLIYILRYSISKYLRRKFLNKLINRAYKIFPDTL